MANKEALKELFELAVFDNNCDLDKCSKCSAALQKNCGPYQYYKTIEKDLEVLEQLKTIEEELGIDLLILFKALENGIWVKHSEDNIIRHLCSKLGYQVCGFFSLGGIKFEDTYYNEYYYSYKDYGKTWALTRKELE